MAVSFLFPTTLVLNTPPVGGEPPGSTLGVLRNLLLSAVQNPAKALMEANFIGILAWAIGLGVMRAPHQRGHAPHAVRSVRRDLGPHQAGDLVAADVAMQVVAIGFVISVAQDSAETALNSSTDVLLTAAGCPQDVRLPGRA